MSTAWQWRMVRFGSDAAAQYGLWKSCWPWWRLVEERGTRSVRVGGGVCRGELQRGALIGCAVDEESEGVSE